MTENQMEPILELLDDLAQDESIPKNVKTKFLDMKGTLSSQESLSIKVNKVLADLEEISEDTNIDMHTRTQIWGLSSMLEALHA